MKRLLSIMAIGGMTLGLFYLFGMYQISSPQCSLWCKAGAETKTEPFIIRDEDSKDEVIKKLKDKGFIRNEAAFKVISFFSDDSPIVPGEYMISTSMSAQELSDTLHAEPRSIWVYVPQFEKTEEVAKLFGEKFNWDYATVQNFVAAFNHKVNDHFKKEALDILGITHAWSDIDKEAAKTIYDQIDYDLIIKKYDMGVYLIPQTEDTTLVVDALYEQIAASPRMKQLSFSSFHKEGEDRFVDSVRRAIELRPDIIPLPAYDIKISKINNKTLLIFSTEYWNNGTGPLELIPTERNEGRTTDVLTGIHQRIYLSDGSYRDRIAGIFLWHAEHNHYHFDQFMDYVLEPVDNVTPFQPLRQKTSFCVRDTKLVQTLDNTPASPKYNACSTHIQGVSVGWGDTYKYTLADQDIDITDVPKGLYRLIFEVNKKNSFDEIRTDNNRSSVLLYLDPAKQLVEIREE